MQSNSPEKDVACSAGQNKMFNYVDNIIVLVCLISHFTTNLIMNVDFKFFFPLHSLWFQIICLFFVISKGAGKLIFEKVPPDDESILEYDCDILAPCASSYILSQRTIPKVSAKVICGAANNQLTSPVADCKLLEHQGSTYVVDFVANRMVP